MGKLGDIAGAMKLMKNKVAIQSLVGFHDALFRYRNFLKFDLEKTDKDLADQMHAAFLMATDTYVLTLQSVGLLPPAPSAEDAETPENDENLANTG